MRGVVEKTGNEINQSWTQTAISMPLLWRVGDQGANLKNNKKAIICAAMLIAIPFISKHEGTSLTSYQDIAGVYTICNGVAHVQPGLTYTPEQCKKLTESKVGEFMEAVANSLTVDVSPQTLAAHTSFAYNIGLSGYKKSQTLKLTNVNRLVDGCRAMLNWYTAGGKDCRIHSNNCYGVYSRRMDEMNLCLKGI